MDRFYLHTEKLTVGYHGKPLIRDIEFYVEQGQILTLIGPNGAGKSTILKSLIRQLEPLGGIVYLEQRAMRELTGTELARKMSAVMTQRTNPELMTCEDVVAMGRYPYTGRLGILSETDRRKVREALELVHALELAEQDFLTLSDGQRQKILLARAICQEPEVMVLDEPTSFLDIRHKLELLTILKQMAAEKHMAVILSLHELDLAQKISDRVACVHGDRIERYGTPEEIFSSSYIMDLYGVTKGSYSVQFGSLEMEPCMGTPKVFVIGGNGSGIPVYRRLQREGIPFAAGILHENDIDYQVAKALASQVIAEKAFEPISDAAFEEAVQVLKSCEKMICCLTEFGSQNKRNRQLVEMWESERKNLW